MDHDALRVSALIRDIFASGRNRVAFFLGAGCPVSIQLPTTVDGITAPLIPDVAGLTGFVLAELLARNAALHGKLQTYIGEQGLPPGNIELILGRVRAIIDIVGPHPFGVFAAGELLTINEEICGSISRRVKTGLPIGENGYRSISTWVAGMAREHPVEIFTLNYDLLMEQALEECRITTFDGFTGSRLPFFNVPAIERDDLPSSWTRFWKLHGSVNWSQDESMVTRRTDNIADCNSLIHPSHRKYDESRRLPYLALLDRLRSYLRKPSSAIFLSGYSFSDEHINEVLLEGLEQNPTASAFALQFGSLATNALAVDTAKKRPNISVYTEDGAVIGTRVGKWHADPGADQRIAQRIFVPGGGEEWTGGNRKFLLGDFARFAPFLLDMTGAVGSKS